VKEYGPADIRNIGLVSHQSAGKTTLSEAMLHAVSFLEPLDTPGGIDKLLLTGKERVTSRADFRRDLGLGGTGQK